MRHPILDAMISFKREYREGARHLTKELAASPLFPVLRITRVIETVVASGLSVAWSACAVLATAIYVFTDETRGPRRGYPGWRRRNRSQLMNTKQKYGDDADFYVCVADEREPDFVTEY